MHKTKDYGYIVLAILLLAFFIYGGVAPYIFGRSVNVIVSHDGSNETRRNSPWYAIYENKEVFVRKTSYPKTVVNTTRSGVLWGNEIWLKGLNYFHIIPLFCFGFYFFFRFFFQFIEKRQQRLGKPPVVLFKRK